MRHDGILFQGRQQPVFATSSTGQFKLQLFLFDRQWPHQVEPWRLMWNGPDAQHFHDRHMPGGKLAPGTALYVVASHVRAHQGGRVGAEIHARIVLCEIAPQRPKALDM